MSKQPNYYRILGITPLAGEQEIKRAYRALAKRYHPDTMPPERREWARDQMARINAAYRVLNNPQLRARYDLERGYTSRLHPPFTTPVGAPETSSTNSALWRRQRARERLRRQRAKQWHTIAIACGVASAIGIVITLLFVRTRPGLAISALLNAGLLAVLFISLGAANR